MRVELRIEAREDLAEGAAFYDRQRSGLGDYFIESIFTDLEALESLGSHAGIHEVIFGFHRKLASRFPFAIYYLTARPPLQQQPRSPRVSFSTRSGLLHWRLCLSLCAILTSVSAQPR